MKAYEFPFYTIIGLFVEIYCKFCESQLFKKPIFYSYFDYFNYI